MNREEYIKIIKQDIDELNQINDSLTKQILINERKITELCQRVIDYDES